MEGNKEEKSFSLGRLDIVDLYEWKNSDKLVYKTYFQRQFVWKEKDKRDLIDTIMQGLPIPAIFICDAGTDFTSLSKRYNVLDGRQRLESIFEFLENKYKYDGRFFKEFAEDEKKCILNYNITLIQMYIEPDNTEKIKEIFKRLNKNSYNLNRMEKQSTQLVEYDYMIIAKIVAGLIRFENIDSYLNEIHELFEDEEGTENETEISNYSENEDEGNNIPADIKQICKWENICYINKILTEDYVFTSYERQRQIAVQYFLNIFSCIIKEEMINRNVSEKMIIELSNVDKKITEEKLIMCNKACKELIEIYEGDIDAFWKNKTSFFSLCYVLTVVPDIIDKKSPEIISDMLDSFQNVDSADWRLYYEASNQGVNDKKIREQRVSVLTKVLS
ncbi:MAG: DUF262 domain-containing protein [Lachnospiraceae bacterium]